ncbi:EAL domain-containing protein [Psychrosphaera haliotis]|uniref:EAL domain-containing protein n=1 Tax=Psychrosphaera haliotis TaxID=555083 RepID=A0A6N8F4D2_9GAMM|nr:EAL domain-containing protein [Psychrosphaera haliotis]MUH71425.1 EAL domain-containing protein [Psychrosphaera haliotis]
MTLFKEIVAVIILTFCINLMGVLWLQFDSTKEYLTNQLESDLENMSSSLTIAVAPHLESGDNVMIDATLNAYFDGGYYKKISVTKFDTNEIITKEMEVAVDGVPQWFLDLEILSPPFIENEVTSGWYQVGKIKVVGHPGFAYKQLWTSFVQTIIWLGGLGLFVIFVCSYAINFVLRPLVRIQEKAKQIQSHYFGEPLPVPTTKELRDVTVAVNQMTDKLKEQFEEKTKLHSKLEQAAYVEPVTGFGNRNYFNRRLDAWLKESGNGILVLIQIASIEEMRKSHGWQKRDELMVVIGHYINTIFDNDETVIKTRTSERDFILIVQESDKREVELKLKQLATYFSTVEIQELFDNKNIYSAAGVKVSHKADKESIVALLDQTLIAAKESTSGVSVVEIEPNCGHIHTRTEIKEALELAISESHLSFRHQPVFLYNSIEPEHFEVFTQVHIEGFKNVTLGTFISVMNEHKLGSDFDKNIIAKAFEYAKGNESQVLALNITKSAMKNYQFIMWLCNKVKDNCESKDRIVFEFNEDSVLNDMDNVNTLCECLNELNFKYGIDRVGRNFESLSYLKSVHPDYVKVDHIYTEMVLKNDDDAYFVDSLCTTIHNLDIKVIATHVENEMQLEKLKKYNFDGYQGFVIPAKALAL